MGKDKLPTQREAVILAILINGERYGRQIRNEYQRRTGETMPLGSLYTTLDRMESQHSFIKSRHGETTPTRGTNRRKYFKLTANGHRALEAAQVRSQVILGEVGRE